ncbi:MAG: hypothetical protein QXW32_01335, partial [Nitrososphaerales archaeon]
MQIEYTDPDEVFKELLKAQQVKPQVLTVNISDAFNFVLAEDVASPIDVPAFNSSHLDGFAVRSMDTEGASLQNPIILNIKGSIDLGELPPVTIQKGDSYQVRTGSYLPEGCDAVVGKEDVKVEGDKVYVTKPVKPGSEVVRKGSDVAKGMVVLRAG